MDLSAYIQEDRQRDKIKIIIEVSRLTNRSYEKRSFVRNPGIRHLMLIPIAEIRPLISRDSGVGSREIC